MKTTKTKTSSGKKTGHGVDADNPMWTEKDFQNAKRFGQLPKPLQQGLRAISRGRPRKDNPKKQISLRMDAGLVDHLRQTNGYNRRIESMLIEAWKNSRL